MATRFWTDRSVVYLVKADEDFLPQSPWSFPETFSAAKIYVKNVSLEDARAMVRCFNKTAIDLRCVDPKTWNRNWMIAGACPRAKGIDKCIRVVSKNMARRADA